MGTHFDLRRTLIYLGFAYGIAIAVTVVIVLSGGLQHSPALFTLGGAPIPLALVLLATVYMFAPTYSHLLTRWITREGWGGVNLRPLLRRGWRYWLIAYFHPIILTVLGAALFFVVSPQYFDPKMTAVVQTATQALKASAQSIPASALPALILTQATLGIAVGVFINCLFTFGEEFGWRSYLLMRLAPLGWRRAMLLMGLIWGTWHWPILLLGYNYGLDVPGAPWSGMLMFILFTWSAGTVLAWLSLKAGSLWPGVIGHAAINACAGLGILFVQNKPDTLLGPAPIGIVGMAPWLIVAIVVFLRPGLPAEPVSAPDQGQAGPLPGLDAAG